MNYADIEVKLMDAQDLLRKVYRFAIDNDLVDLERQMSVADTCIVDALEDKNGLE
jgi:hypothetical protein